MTVRRALLAGIAAAWVASLDRPVLATEYNKRTFPDPSQQAKVQEVIARSRLQGSGGSMLGGGIGPGQDVTQVGCGSLQLGNVNTTGRAGERVPQQNIVVARDVINVAPGCKR